MDPDTQTLLDQSIASLRLGNKEEARRKLMQVINVDEDNELAWLYLSEAVESDADRLVCLENVLTLNSANQQAATALSALQAKMGKGKPEAPAPSSYAPSPVGFEQQPVQEVQHKSFMELLDTWAEMFTLPGQARLDEERAYARWGPTVLGILLASVVTNFVTSLAWFGATPPELQQLLSEAGSLLPGTTLTPGLETLLPCTCGTTLIGAAAGLFNFFLGSALLSVVARFLGGRGSFEVQSYLLSLVYGPYGLASSIVAPLALLGTISPVLSFIPTLIAIPIGIMSLIMMVRALKATHGYGTGAALGTLFGPAILLTCCVVMLVLVLAAGSELPHP